MNRAGDVVILGGGAIGLAIAFELARAGAAVRVVDSGEAGKGASWAAAGMLAPLTERLPNAAMQSFCEASFALYPAFVQEVLKHGGVDPHLRLGGIVHAAYDEQRVRELDAIATRLRIAGHRAELLDREAVVRAEPALGRRITGALLVHGEGQIDNRRLVRALRAACERCGVRIHERAEDVALECDARRQLGVRTNAGFLPAETVVNAAGAWAAELRGVPEEFALAVRPVRGQMIAVAIPDGFMRRTVWAPDCYFVPRADGRLLIGATVEEAGFDARTTVSGVTGLLNAALSAVPALAGFTLTEQWAGLRPGTADGLPFIGPTPLEGYAVATGHFRNGILLAPATAQMVARGLLRGDWSGAEPFSPLRGGTAFARA